MSDLSTPRRNFPGRLFMPLLVVALIVGAFVLLYKSAAAKRAFRVSGDSTDIRLIGVIPDGGDEILDPESGKTALGLDGAPLARLIDYDGTFSVWDDEQFSAWVEKKQVPRTFVFELPPGGPPLRFLPSRVTNVSVPYVLPGPPHFSVRTRPDQRTVACLKASVRTTRRVRWLMGFLSMRRPVDTVDVTLRYFIGDERGKPDVAFDGPFAVGDVLQDEATGSYTLTVSTSDLYRAGSASFRIAGTAPVEHGAPFIAYDKHGGWHLALPAGGTTSGRKGKATFSFDYVVRDVPLKDITRVTFNEKPSTRVFHNVRVAYPDRPKRTYAPYLDDLAARLGITDFDPKNLARRTASSGPEAIECIDLWRSVFVILQAWSAVAHN